MHRGRVGSDTGLSMASVRCPRVRDVCGCSAVFIQTPIAAMTLSGVICWARNSKRSTPSPSFSPGPANARPARLSLHFQSHPRVRSVYGNPAASVALPVAKPRRVWNSREVSPFRLLLFAFLSRSPSLTVCHLLGQEQQALASPAPGGARKVILNPNL